MVLQQTSRRIAQLPHRVFEREWFLRRCNRCHRAEVVLHLNALLLHYERKNPKRRRKFYQPLSLRCQGEGANPHTNQTLRATTPPTSDGIRTVGCSLQKLVPDVGQLDAIRQAVASTHRATILATELLNMHLRRMLTVGDARTPSGVFVVAPDSPITAAAADTHQQSRCHTQARDLHLLLGCRSSSQCILQHRRRRLHKLLPKHFL